MRMRMRYRYGLGARAPDRANVRTYVRVPRTVLVKFWNYSIRPLTTPPNLRKGLNFDEFLHSAVFSVGSTAVFIPEMLSHL